MDAFKTTATVARNGVVTLYGLPFMEGVEVEVTMQVCPEGTGRLELDPQ